MYLYISFDLVHRWSAPWRELTVHLAGYASQHKRYPQKATESFFSIFTGFQAIYGIVSEKMVSRLYKIYDS